MDKVRWLYTVVILLVLQIIINIYQYHVGSSSGEITFWKIMAHLTLIYSTYVYYRLLECRDSKTGNVDDIVSVDIANDN